MKWNVIKIMFQTTNQKYIYSIYIYIFNNGFPMKSSILHEISQRSQKMPSKNRSGSHRGWKMSETTKNGWKSQGRQVNLPEGNILYIRYKIWYIYILYKKHQNFPIEIPTFKGPLLNKSPFHPPCWAYSARSVGARLRPPDAPRASPSRWRRGITARHGLMRYLQSMDVNGGSKQTKTNKKHSWWMLMMDTHKKN